MGWICEHCEVPFLGLAHRVRSEESGIVLLDLIVCHHCYMAARQLGLHTEEVRGQSVVVPNGEMKKG